MLQNQTGLRQHLGIHTVFVSMGRSPQGRRGWSHRVVLLQLFFVVALVLTAAKDEALDTPFGDILRSEARKGISRPNRGPVDDAGQRGPRKEGDDAYTPGVASKIHNAVEESNSSANSSRESKEVLLDGASSSSSDSTSNDTSTGGAEKTTEGLNSPDEAERQDPGMFARGRAMSAPFIRHYSKQMVILWEWYTKTTGATMNGKRKQDEDALLVHAPSHWQRNVRFKAVFDGHGGSAVSRTCVAQFCNFFGNMADLSAETFKRTSLLLDAVIRADPVRHERGGSTGLIVAIERPDERIPKFKIHVSNVGDSRAFILHQNGSYTIMSKDHKPNDPEEVARINRAGGFVSRVRKVYRVDGTLSVSRAYGDIRMKANPTLPATEQKVVAIPDVRTFDAFEGDYIFMACDGNFSQATVYLPSVLNASYSLFSCMRYNSGLSVCVFFLWLCFVEKGLACAGMFEAPGMSWDFVANLLHRELQSTNDNLVETAFRMLNTAYLLGSADNISIVLTKLMNRKRNSSITKRFTYDFSGRREFVETQLLSAPNIYRSGTYHTSAGPVVTLF
ncbi:protein phosphatase 2C, putative [Eimeria praecox]|uniref:protein-serine/threonine phosphatase n=1 Tax=Eimeria praecox TaxID=51316 RepID=U6GH49_9EIME|nr:protein phosphatase 2C, putative [Eimeria praecox]